MRSVFSADHKHFAFSDAFGLTRWSLPGKVKTERKITAGLDAVLSANPARTELLAWRQNWDSMHHLAFPALKALTRLDRFRLSQSVLTPDGSFADLGAEYDGARHALVVRRWRDPATQQGAVDLTNTDAPMRPRVTIDGATEGPRWGALVSSPAGVWALLRGAEATLYVGDFEGDAGRVRWRAPVNLPREAFVTLHPFDDGRVVLAAFMPSRRESVLVRFEADGRVAGVHTLASLGPAVPVSFERALHQYSEATVGSTPLDGGITRTAGLGDHGVGRVFGDGASEYLLAWHGEYVVDLGTAERLPRKLADEDRALRRFFREQVARANAIGNPGGMLFELRTLDVNPARHDYGFAWDATAGTGSLHGLLAAGSLCAFTDDDASRSVDGWRWSVGGGLMLDVDHGRWSEDEVDAAFGALEAAGVPLLEALQCLDRCYEFRAEAPAPQRNPFVGGGARRFLGGLTWALAHRGSAGLRAGARELGGSLSAATVAEALRALPSERGSRVSYYVLDILACVAVDALRGEATPVLAAVGSAPDAWSNGLSALFEPALRWLASEVPDRAALARALGGSGRAAFYVQRALG